MRADLGFAERLLSGGCEWAAAAAESTARQTINRTDERTLKLTRQRIGRILFPDSLPYVSLIIQCPITDIM
jgi:hypothetical protein